MGSADAVTEPMRASGNAVDWIIRASTAGVVIGVAAVAAYVSYQHAYELVSTHGESGATARLVPLTVDGLVYASSMAMLDAARHKRATPLLAHWLLGAGIVATLAANVAHGVGNGPVGAVVAAWPAAALVGTYELLMALVRGGVRRSTKQNDTQPAATADAQSEPQTLTRQTPVVGIEYDGNDHQNEQNGHEDDEELKEARQVAEEYWKTHQRWVRRDELRERLRCSSRRATELLRALKESESSGSR